ncbi:hypothetical protein BC834DRAFT_949284 [Gloeopeniophorella convolvens]|nr:hypothetical protein BC834DRAFT_949284 [Gloeopeniophorella convolvens]
MAQTTKKSPKGTKKEKIFHPDSRKAGQLARKQLRKSKLAGQASKRAKLHSAKADFYGFFFHALPEEGVLTLPELHELVSDVWLTRNDTEIEEERAQRRKGRPKSTKELKLEEIKLREAEEYRTGMEVPDLTHPENVALYRKWDQKEVAFVQMLRCVRISSEKPDLVIVSKPGKYPSLATPRDVAMDDVPVLLDHSSNTDAMLS